MSSLPRKAGTFDAVPDLLVRVFQAVKVVRLTQCAAVLRRQFPLGTFGGASNPQLTAVFTLELEGFTGAGLLQQVQARNPCPLSWVLGGKGWNTEISTWEIVPYHPGHIRLFVSEPENCSSPAFLRVNIAERPCFTWPLAYR